VMLPPPPSIKSSKILRSREPTPRSSDIMTLLSLKTFNRRLGVSVGSGMASGRAVDAPRTPSACGISTASSGFFRKISGSGSRYGFSSIRFPSFKQSSNLLWLARYVKIHLCTYQWGNTILHLRLFSTATWHFGWSIVSAQIWVVNFVTLLCSIPPIARTAPMIASLSPVGISAQDRVIFEKIRFGSGVYPRI
jgi:hypothetical protein